MLKIAALVFMPIAAVTFGVLSVTLAAIPAASEHFARGATLYYGAAALSMLLAIPTAWLVARRMLTHRERRLLDSGVGTRA